MTVGESFTCANCGGTFEKKRSDEEAAAEMMANFGERFTTDDCDIICDDCYKQFMPWAVAQGGIVNPESPYLLCERGPELILPRSAQAEDGK